MDPTRFDHLTEALVARPSRRAAVVGLLALLTGGLLGATPEDAAARRPNCRGPRCHRRPGGRRSCRPGSQWRRGRCRPTAPCRPTCAPNGTNCGPDGCGGSCGSCVTGQICQDRRCHGGGGTDCHPTCSGATPDCCGATCVDTTTDNNHCGACGFSCGPGFVCKGAACYEDRCTSAETRCGGRCTNLASDPANCGFCGNRCPADRAGCQGGSCCTRNGQRCPANCTAGQGCLGCCGGICDDTGVCSANALPCLGDGRACPASCAPGAICYRCCSLTCLDNGTCGTPPPPCQPNGAACPAGCAAGSSCAGCCSGACGMGGACGASTSCLPYGGVCSSSAECCNDVPCTAGRCRLD